MSSSKAVSRAPFGYRAGKSTRSVGDCRAGNRLRAR
jgi:hypothetical protein